LKQDKIFKKTGIGNAIVLVDDSTSLGLIFNSQTIANSVPLQSKESKILSRFHNYLLSNPTLPVTPKITRKRKNDTQLVEKQKTSLGKRIKLSIIPDFAPTLRERTPQLNRKTRKIIEVVDSTVIQKSLL